MSTTSHTLNSSECVTPHSELGNREIHKKKSVMIEGGPVPRAKVMDQMVVDRYLMDGLLTLAQHQAAEFLLGQASIAGIWAKAPDPDRPRGGKKDYTPTGVFPFSDTLKIVSKKFGPIASYIVEEVVCHNWDVSDNAVRMKVLQDSLQLICDRRMSGGRNPVNRLKGR